eukprot:UN06575
MRLRHFLLPRSWEYVVTCEDSYGDGWGYGGVQGWLQINGNVYCDEFTSTYLYSASLTVDAPTDAPTETMEPTDTAEPTGDECADVLVEISMTADQYPAEMSWSVNEECSSSMEGDSATCCLAERSTPAALTLTETAGHTR